MTRIIGVLIHWLGLVLLLSYAGGVAGNVAGNVDPQIDFERLEKQNWVQVKGHSFSLLSDAGTKQAVDLAEKLALFNAVFSKVSGYTLPENIPPVKLIATRHQDTYQLLAGSSPSLRVTNGIYFNSLSGHYAIAKLRTRHNWRTRRTLVASLFHEYVHHLSAFNTTGEMPYWYAEGLAEFLSTAKFSKDNKVYFGAPRERYVDVLNSSAWQSVEDVLKAPNVQSMSKRQLEKFYALSWLLVSYSYLVDDEVNNLDRYLQLLREGVSVDEAFKRSFAVTYEALDKKLQQFVKANQFPRKPFKAVIPVIIDQGSDAQRATALSTAQALTQIGEFLLLGLKDAERATSVLSHANDIAPVEDADTLAMLAMASNELSEAEHYLLQAFRLQPESTLVRLASAQLNVQRMESASNDKQHALYYQAATDDYAAVLQQEADNLVALYELGDLWAANGEIEKALETFEKALAAAPGSTPVREALIILYFHLGETKLAENLIAAVLRNPHLTNQQTAAFLEWVESFKANQQ